MIRQLLRRWADASTRADIVRLERELADSRADLDAERRTNRVAQAEIDAMADVIARDRERIRAEASSYSRQRAEQEGVEADTAN